jgi:hypothetical protein
MKAEKAKQSKRNAMLRGTKVMNGTRLLATLAVAALAICPLNSAQAALTLELRPGGGPAITIVDEGAGDLALGTVGVVSFIGTVGVFDLNISFSQSKPVVGDFTSAQLELNSSTFSIDSSGVGTLDILASDTHFGGVPGTHAGTLTADGTYNIGMMATGSSVTAKAIFDPTNSLFGEDGGLPDEVEIAFLPATTSPINSPFGPTLAAVTINGFFSLTNVISIDSKGAFSGQADIDSSIVRNDGGPLTPEPASMIVWGLGAGLIGAVGYFKGRRKVA